MNSEFHEKSLEFYQKLLSITFTDSLNGAKRNKNMEN